jgi:hypothetical protein
MRPGAGSFDCFPELGDFSISMARFGILKKKSGYNSQNA